MWYNKLRYVIKKNKYLQSKKLEKSKKKCSESSEIGFF